VIRSLHRTWGKGFAAAIVLLAATGASLAAEADSVAPERVLQVVSGDWNGDGTDDRALLVISELA
jgi:hypothetical protein